MLTELARIGTELLLGDGRGKTHLVRVVSGEFEDGQFARPVVLEDIRQARRGISDVEPLVCKRLEYQAAGLRAVVAFADRTWFVQRG
jgi:hypothetical protein